jgi:hypothetical protein
MKMDTYDLHELSSCQLHLSPQEKISVSKAYTSNAEPYLLGTARGYGCRSRISSHEFTIPTAYRGFWKPIASSGVKVVQLLASVRVLLAQHHRTTTDN